MNQPGTPAVITPNEQSDGKRLRIAIAGVAVLLAVTGIGIKVYLAYSAKTRLAEAYPRLESLIAIYSVLNWRSPEQRPPKIVEKSETSGSEFLLNCPEIEWGKGGLDRGDLLFGCFSKPRRIYIPEAGEEVDTIQFIAAHEFTYEFAWDSVFGYEFKIHVRGHEHFDGKSGVNEDIKACIAERSQDDSTCHFHVYVVSISGLTVAKSVTFLTSNGHLVWHPDGSVSRSDERVIYLSDGPPAKVGQLNAVVQKTLRTLGFAESDLSKVAPQLEVMWMSKDENFLRALSDELDRAPDLTALSSYIQGK